tara:strand:+ start:826 stop:1824 length:999 start_codon:yes stop_codon:yes gene_type:complete
MKPNWGPPSSRLRAHLKSIKAAKVCLASNSLFDLVPERVLLDYCEAKNRLTEYVFETYPRPSDYDFLSGLNRVTEKVKTQRLNVNMGDAREYVSDPRARFFFKKLKTCSDIISYDIFGTKTGRLTTKKGSFPILTMDKNYRAILKPANDCFLELDFNAAELRALLALSEIEQPQGDLHKWNVQNLFKGKGTREEAKKRVFAWLYNPESKDYALDKTYDRSSVVKKYFTGDKVTTFFDRTIPCDDHHALNYIIQSTASDIFLRQMVKVAKKLEGKKSFIAFSIHDSLVLDMSVEDKHMVTELWSTFSDTEFGNFKTTIKIGKNFGIMKQLEGL